MRDVFSEDNLKWLLFIFLGSLLSGFMFGVSLNNDDFRKARYDRIKNYEKGLYNRIPASCHFMWNK